MNAQEILISRHGLRAPELKDLEQAAWKDNRLATFAVLPADATVILVNGELKKFEPTESVLSPRK
ncbi:unnamed protein product, partial [Rotaria socialis]